MCKFTDFTLIIRLVSNKKRYKRTIHTYLLQSYRHSLFTRVQEYGCSDSLNNLTDDLVCLIL